MASKVVEYDRLLSNVTDMINLLEYDAMRGSGKAKLNAATLVSLYELKDRYEAATVPVKAVEETASKEVPAKRGPKPKAEADK